MTTTAGNQMFVYPADGSGVWMIDHVGPHAEGIRELFGTTILPSPFRLPCTAEAVTECLRSANPGVSVEAFGSEWAWRKETGNV